MHIAHCTRTQIVRAMRPTRACAEVGVLRGDFSAQILDAVDPSMLYLVDPWWHDDDPDYADDPANVAQPDMDEAHRFVRARFTGQGHRVTVVRCASPDAASGFASESLDWVFLDAKHTTRAVVRDLLAWERTVRPDGAIICHDYIDGAEATALRFGVVEAVLWFCRSHGWRIAVRTDEKYSTIVLVGPRPGPARLSAARILRALRRERVTITEVDEARGLVV